MTGRRAAGIGKGVEHHVHGPMQGEIIAEGLEIPQADALGRDAVAGEAGQVFLAYRIETQTYDEQSRVGEALQQPAP